MYKVYIDLYINSISFFSLVIYNIYITCRVKVNKTTRFCALRDPQSAQSAAKCETISIATERTVYLSEYFLFYESHLFLASSH